MLLQLRFCLCMALGLMTGLAVSGCRAADDFGRCDGMEARAIAGPQLEIHWDPAECDIYQASIIQGGSVTWSVTMNQQKNGIGSPLTYGVAPLGTDGSQAQPLTFGPYRVVLIRIDEKHRIYTGVDTTFAGL